jgi:hypothetical protein
MKGTNIVLLEPDVAKVFRDSAVVSQALREYLSEHGVPPTVPKQEGGLTHAESGAVRPRVHSPPATIAQQMAEHFSFDAVEYRSPVGALELTGTGRGDPCFDLSRPCGFHTELLR